MEPRYIKKYLERSEIVSSYNMYLPKEHFYNTKLGWQTLEQSCNEDLQRF